MTVFAQVSASRSGVLRYRPEIDGLRALAILPVVFFHYGIWGFRGGFVGVDVFFVISGYLITGQLQADIDRGAFSIARFYERRVRRIGPALLAMLIAVSVACYFLMLPNELWRYGWSAICTLFSVSNFYFWVHTGYFGGAASSKPLLHTWSLGVEEQFYLLFPVVLYLTSRLGILWRNAIIVALLFASFALSVYDSIFYPDAAFYFSHARAWELLIGAAAAIGIVRCPQSLALRTAMVALGILMVCASVVFITPEMPFPGVTALLPCVGSLLVICGGMRGETLPGRLLSVRPLVFIGLISYSLYLWHWPLIVFERTYHVIPAIDSSYRSFQVSLIAASIVVATVSWRWIETPFRSRKLFAPRALLVASASLAAIVLAVGLTYVEMEGFPARYPANVARLSSFLDYDTIPIFEDGTCFLSSHYTIADYEEAQCLRAGPGRNILLVGDSHAAQFWYGLAHTLPGTHVLLAAASGCKPIVPYSGLTQCTQLMRHVFDDVLRHRHFDMVIVSARWTKSDLAVIGPSLKLWSGLHQPIVIIGPSPEFDTDLPRLLIAAQLKHDDALPQRHVVPDIAAADAALRRLSESDRFKYVSIDRLLCTPRCPEWVGSVPFAFDYGHFTSEGSVLAAKKFEAAAGLSGPAPKPNNAGTPGGNVAN